MAKSNVLWMASKHCHIKVQIDGGPTDKHKQAVWCCPELLWYSLCDGPTDWLPFVCYNKVKRLWNLIGRCDQKWSLPGQVGGGSFMCVGGHRTNAGSYSIGWTDRTDRHGAFVSGCSEGESVELQWFLLPIPPLLFSRALRGSCESGQLSAVCFPCSRYSLARPIYAGWCICLLGLWILTNAIPPSFFFVFMDVAFFSLCSAFFQALRDEEVTTKDQREPTHSALWYHQAFSESIIRIPAMCMCDLLCLFLLKLDYILIITRSYANVSMYICGCLIIRLLDYTLPE